MERKKQNGNELGFKEKISYGAGTFGDQLSTNGVTNVVNPLFNIFLGANPALVGTALMLGKIVDAFTDPLMGLISDNTRSKYGRRRPYILFGGFMCAIAFLFPWLVSPGWQSQWQIVFLIVATTIVAIFATVYTVPWTALGMELTPDYNERNSVMAYRSFFSMFCFVAIIPWLWRWCQADVFANPVVGMRWLSIGAGLFIILGALMCFKGCKERYYNISKAQAKQKFFKSVAITFKNRSFLIILGLTLCQVVGMSAVASLGVYVSTYHVFGGNIKEGASWIAIVQVVTALAGMASLPLIVKAAKKYGKRLVMAGTFVLAIIGSISQWFFFTPTMPLLQVIPPLFIAPANAAFWMINGSMRADLADDDEVKTGIRREGTYGSIARWFEKMAYSLNYFIAGMILAWVGFDGTLEGNQTVETITGIRLAFCYYPIILCVIGLVLIKIYPLTEKKMKEYREILENRRGKIK